VGIVLIIAIIAYVMYFMPGDGVGGNPTTTTLAPAAPAADDINVVILNDLRCGADCDLTRLIYEIRQLFPNAVLRELDYNDPFGKRVFEDANVRFLPAVFIEKRVRETPQFQNIRGYLEEGEDYYSLRLGANWDPYCDATQDNCAKPQCSERINCRPEIPGKLDLFTMSECPYSTMALEAMEDILYAFGEEITFNVNYIASVDEGGVITSLKGESEVMENIRRLCAAKHYPNAYLDYIWCQSKELNGGWEDCAIAAGINVDDMIDCISEGEGKELLVDNVRMAQDLNIIGSPTFLVNNKKLFNAVTAEEIREGICEANPDFKGCEAALVD
jgi:hypothetical protein